MVELDGVAVDFEAAVDGGDGGVFEGGGEGDGGEKDVELAEKLVDNGAAIDALVKLEKKT